MLSFFALFSVAHNFAETSVTRNDKLLKFPQWGYLWKMIFNSDASKQVQMIAFPWKARATNDGTIYFNNVTKIIGIITDEGKYSETSKYFFYLNLISLIT